MKILNLYFKNLNSLEGENRIDFELPPFTDTGVFAITGPNGSGKTSILDAITLALYGETFRFDKPARHVITQQTDECFAQIEFVIGSERYRSSWRVKRDPASSSGEVLASEMRLVKINPIEEILGTSVVQVCDKVAELTGMSFRSFTRSILLAQGDFTAFLNALDNERMDILEKIISTDIYAEHKKEVTGKLAEAQKTLNYLQEDLAAVALITPEALEACEYDLADFSDQVAEFQESIHQLTQSKTAFSEIDALKDQIATKEKQLQNAITQRIEVQKKLDQLAEGEIARTFSDDIAGIGQRKQQVEQARGELDKLRNELKQLEATLALPDFAINSVDMQEKLSDRQAADVSEQKQTLEGLRGQMSLVNANWQSEVVLQKTLTDQIAEKQSALAAVDEWLDARPHDFILLENYPQLDRLKTLRLKKAELTEKKKALTKWSKSTQTALQKNKSDFESKTQLLAELKLKLAEAEKSLETISPGHSFEQALELQTEQKERVKDFQDLVNLAITNEKLAPRPTFLDRLFGKTQTPSRLADELESELDGLKAQIKIEENIRLSLERAMFNDALIARMAHDRTYLIDGKPCPLCGATEHPFASHPPATGNSKQALTDQRIKLRRLVADVKDLEEQLSYAKKRAERNQVNDVKLQQIGGHWHTLCNKLNVVSQELDINNIGLMKELLNLQLTELKNIGLLIDEFKSVQNKIAKLTGQIQKTGLELEQIQPNIFRIEGEWQNGPTMLGENESEHAKVAQEELDLTAALTEQLTLLGEKLPAFGQEDLLNGLLTQRRLDYQSYAERKQTLNDEIDLFNSKLAAGQTQIETYKVRFNEVNERLHIEEIVGLHLALVEKQKLVADKEDKFNQVFADFKELESAIGLRLQDTPFNSLSDVETMLVLLPEQPRLAEQYELFESNISLWGAELDKLDQRLSVLTEQLGSKMPLEEIELKLTTAKEKSELAEMEAHRLEAIIREQKQLQQKHENITAQIQSQQITINSASVEVAELAAENGMAFRRRVQEKLIQDLLSQANAILEKISGRYYVRHKPNERGLALEIEDTFQGNLHRSPKTLSGGESFIVSLALALGLSEIASQGRSLDSLFLDEGFGNLDAETLYTVITTLEGLRAHGKTVGVISHVAAVQQRFKAQLQLIKKPNGLGELRKVS